MNNKEEEHGTISSYMRQKMRRDQSGKGNDTHKYARKGNFSHRKYTHKVQDIITAGKNEKEYGKCLVNDLFNRLLTNLNT
jgi:hypothetical protein